MLITSQRNYLAAAATINYTDNEHVEKGRTAVRPLFRFDFCNTDLNFLHFKQTFERAVAAVIVRPIRHGGVCTVRVVSFAA